MYTHTHAIPKINYVSSARNVLIAAINWSCHIRIEFHFLD